MPQLPVESYQMAKSVREALALRRSFGKKGAYIAGGTRLFREERKGRLSLIDVSRLGLDRIEKRRDRLVIGATATLTALLETKAVSELASGVLAEAASATVSWMIRNAQSVGGLVAEGAPDVDLLPALLALDAEVVSQDTKTRREPLSRFLSRRRAAETLVLSLEAPLDKRDRGAFLRLARTANDVPLVSVAALVKVERGRISRARLAASGARPGPRRLFETEALLEGKPVSAELLAEVGAKAAAECGLSGDHRASSEYRRAMVEPLILRALERALS